MTLAHITTYYPAFLRTMVSAPGETPSYQGRLESLLAGNFGWFDAWRHALGPRGIEVGEFIANDAVLQRTWLRENGRPIPESDAEACFAALLGQMESLRPEILFIDCYGAFSASQIAALRQAGGCCRLVVGWCGAPYAHASVFEGFDLILSNIAGFGRRFHQIGLASAHLPHAFDPRLETLGKPWNERSGTVFTGSLNAMAGWHGGRLRLLERVCGTVPVQVFADFARDPNPRTVLDRLLGRRPEPGPSLARSLRPAVYGRTMWEVLGACRMTINQHITASRGEASNMRLFEATGMGACLVTEAQDNLRDYFEPGSEVVTYRSPRDCAGKLRWLADHPDEARAIAERGQRRVRAQHTFAHRAPVLLEILNRHLP
jgi:spore maturation protein CgeB